MTDGEKRLVARRAAGEYAVLDACQRIWRAYRRKERSVYTAFLDVIFGNKADGRASLDRWDDYVAAARAVLLLHPEVCSLVEKIGGNRPKPEPVLEPVPEPDPEPEPEPEPAPEPEPEHAQLRRHQILEALRKPWPTRGVDPPG